MIFSGLAVFGLYPEGKKMFLISGNLFAANTWMWMSSSSSNLKLVLVLHRPYMQMAINLNITLTTCLPIIIQPCVDLGSAENADYSWTFINKRFRPNSYQKSDHAKLFFTFYRKFCSKDEFNIVSFVENKPTNYYLHQLFVKENSCISLQFLSAMQPSSDVFHTDKQFSFTRTRCSYRIMISDSENSTKVTSFWMAIKSRLH